MSLMTCIACALALWLGAYHESDAMHCVPQTVDVSDPDNHTFLQYHKCAFFSCILSVDLRVLMNIHLWYEIPADLACCCLQTL